MLHSKVYAAHGLDFQSPLLVESCFRWRFLRIWKSSWVCLILFRAKLVYSPIWFLFWLWQRCVNPICSLICSISFPPSLTSITLELALFATSIVSFSRTKLTRKTHLSNEKKITSCSGYLYRGWNLGIILDHENIRIPIEQLFFFRGSLEQSVWKPPFDTNSEMD